MHQAVATSIRQAG
jgi:hypothetical protein